MRARSYVRVSTDEQVKEGFSLSAQEDRCRQFIQSQAWDNDGSYRDDGYSAKDLQRPGMQQMIEDVKNRDFDVLVVYRLDRLVRSVMDLHYLLKLFDKYDVKFKSVTEVFDTTTATGRLFISIIGSLAQWERENLAERVKMGMERRALEGKRNGARAPYGYQFDDAGHLVPDPKEASIVRRIFEMYQSHGYLHITEWLNKEGIKTRSGSDFGIYNLQYILTNPVYAGLLRWNHRSKGKVTGEGITYEGNHEPLISLELFEETQERIKKRRSKHSRVIASEYPFSGVLRCTRCGERMIGYQRYLNKGKSRHPSYRCRGRVIKKTCDLPTILEKSIEEALFSQMKWIAENIELEPPQDPSTQTDRRKEIEQELERIKKRRKKWQHAFGEDVITLEELRERTKEDREKEKKLREELEKLDKDAPSPVLSEAEILDKLQNLEYIWENATRFERKELIHTIFEEIYVDALPKERQSERTRAQIVDFVF